jgi:hypothetical protein
MRMSRPVLIAIPVACAAATYARFFGGYWLGDDFGNVHGAWLAAQRGDLEAQALERDFRAEPWEGYFNRERLIATLTFD